ncbi:hypothetical protein GCM10023147_20340 [Tsukamurella soli]|uniref:Uncharacterized protein n=1 Tax=Tsukamurella soli TaxID=644556 RepID=A0ABP8JJ55_9ACTN
MHCGLVGCEVDLGLVGNTGHHAVLRHTTMCIPILVAAIAFATVCAGYRVIPDVGTAAVTLR